MDNKKHKEVSRRFFSRKLEESEAIAKAKQTSSNLQQLSSFLQCEQSTADLHRQLDEVELMVCQSSLPYQLKHLGDANQSMAFVSKMWHFKVFDY